MEFIMTYGWAILVVLAAIGALAYFGVLSPSSLLPEKCFFPAGTDCIEKPSIVTAGANGVNVQFVIKNSLGYDVNIDPETTINKGGGDDCDSPTYTYAAIRSILSNGEDEENNCDDGGSPICGTGANEITVDNGGTVTITLNCADGPTAGKRYKSMPSFTYVSVDTGASHVISGDMSGKVAQG